VSQVIEGAAILLLLSIFFAYIVAPAVPPVRRRVRMGKRQRPISDGAALLLIYAVLAVPAFLVWRDARPAMQHWVAVTAPATVEHLFSGGRFVPTSSTFADLPLPATMRAGLVRGATWAAGSLETSARGTLDDLIIAARFTRWLALVPLVGFVLLSAAPVFQRSALRMLPRGHMQWRFEEYLRDVNSALAGYVRAQAAAGVIVGLMSVAGFLLLGLNAAISLGVVAGILELIPGIGPLVALLIAAAANPHRILSLIVVLGMVRVFQDYVIYPRLIRRGMHLSTPAVILTVWIGAALAKAPGVMVAIPIAGCMSVSLRHWREYREIQRLLVSRQRDLEEVKS
jgi:predicted PurR-regulated permease PerM